MSRSGRTARAPPALNQGISVRPQQTVAREIFARPKAEAGPVVDRVDCDHRIRITEGYPSGRARLRQGIEQRLVEMSFDLGRLEIAFGAAPVQADMERSTGETGRPLQNDLLRGGHELIARMKFETTQRRRNTRDRVIKRRAVLGQLFDRLNQGDRIVDRHDQDVMVGAGIERAELAQYATGSPKAVLKDADDDVPIFHGTTLPLASLAPREKAAMTSATIRCS